VNFAEMLDAAMTSRGIGVRALARRVPCDPALISRLARGSQRASAQMARRLDDLLGMHGELVKASAESREAAGLADVAADPLAGDSLEELEELGHPLSGGQPAVRTERVAPELVDYFHSQLAGHYRADMFLGSHFLIPTVTEQYRLIRALIASAEGPVRGRLLEAATAYAALIGWLWQDSGDLVKSARWRSITLDMAHRADNLDLISYALTNKAMLLTDADDGHAVIEFSHAAMQGNSRRLLPKTRVMAAVQSAHGCSMVRRRRECDQLLDDAARLAGQIDDAHAWGNSCRRTSGYFEIQRATCYGRLGLAREAVSIWNDVLAAMPDSARRDRAVFQARQATSLALLGESEQVGHIAKGVADVVRETDSARLRREFAAIRRAMSAWASSPAGRDLSALLGSIDGKNNSRSGRSRE
jgi:hypothetical protein